MSSSQETLTRLLVMVPWVVKHPGVSVDEVCKRFGITRAQLVKDINLILVCGIAPYFPHQLMWAEIDGDEVVISPVDYFERPMRLTRGEALAVLAAGRAAGDIPGVEAPDALKRALVKLERCLDSDSPHGAVDVALNSDPLQLREQIGAAVAEARQLEIQYFSISKQDESTRQVNPLRLFAHNGRWYLHAWCHQADDYRLFRLDRIRELAETDDTFDRSGFLESDFVEPGPGEDAFIVKLRIAPGPMAWFGDHFRVESAERQGDGWTVATVRAASVSWIAQLLVRIGAGAEVVEPDFVRGAVRNEAARILAVYGVGEA